MKTLLMSLNSKYIHSNLAIHSLKRYYEQYRTNDDVELILKEYTINHEMNDVLVDIYRGHYDYIFISCYIWNIDETLSLLENLRKIQPDAKVVLGGPEVGFHPEIYLDKYPYLTGVIIGEGERIFANLINLLSLLKNNAIEDNEIINRLEETKGFAFRKNNKIIVNESEMPIQFLEEIPFVYTDLKAFENRIIYYESTRGCPYRCSYCLSSTCGKVRYLSLDRVKEDLNFFISHKVPQVKFVDRTFNVQKKHALEILKFIHEYDNGITNFHFEITGELLDEDYFDVLRNMREGLVQFEIGIQSTNLVTLEAINRKMDYSKIKDNIRTLLSMQNVHIHLDLIAGLPFETLSIFYKSFDEVYDIKAHQLQLGFLKILKGTLIERQLEFFQYKVRSDAPFEILENMWISFEELSELKEIEAMVERFYNSGKFKNTMAYILIKTGMKPHELYLDLVSFENYDTNFFQPMSMATAYDFLFAYANKKEMDVDIVSELLKFDFYASNMKGQRTFFTMPLIPKFNNNRIHYLNEHKKKVFHHDYYQNLNAKEILKTVNFIVFNYDIIALIQTNFECVSQGINVVMFDYLQPIGALESSKFYSANEMLECDDHEENTHSQ